jgi:hypothetical protein
MLQVIDLVIYVKFLLSIRMIVPIYFLCEHLFFLCLRTQLKAVRYIKEASIEVGKTRYKWKNVPILYLLFKRLCFGDKLFLCSRLLVLFLNKLLYKTA